MTQYLSINEHGIAVGGYYDTYDAMDVPTNWKPVVGNATLGWRWDEVSSTWIEPLVSLEELREQRNLLLQECDYTQLSDSPLSFEESEAWNEYRQKLRDMPQDYVPTPHPSYPEKPTDATQLDGLIGL